MKSLRRRFNNIDSKNSGWGSPICFAEAIREQNFSEQVIRRWFHQLVSKEDYFTNEKTALFQFLLAHTKPTEDDKNQE